MFQGRQMKRDKPFKTLIIVTYGSGVSKSDFRGIEVDILVDSP
jgi:hypothetical protein